MDFPTVVDADGAVKPTPLIRDMPLEADLPDGTSMGRKKRIVEIYLRLHETQGLKVNGQLPVSAFPVRPPSTPCRKFTPATRPSRAYWVGTTRGKSKSLSKIRFH